MKKLGSAQFLAGIAIVASGAAWQLREHLPAPDAQPAQAQATASASASVCGSTRDGLLPARCESMREDERTAPPEKSPRATTQLWV